MPRPAARPYDPVAPHGHAGEPRPEMQDWLIAGQSYEITFPIPSPGQLDERPRSHSTTRARRPVSRTQRTRGLSRVRRNEHRSVSRRPRISRRRSTSATTSCPSFRTSAPRAVSRRAAARAVRRCRRQASSSTRPSGFAATAIGRVSQESNTGARAGAAQPAAAHLGADMPIIEPEQSRRQLAALQAALGAPSPACCATACLRAPTPGARRRHRRRRRGGRDGGGRRRGHGRGNGPVRRVHGGGVRDRLAPASVQLVEHGPDAGAGLRHARTAAGAELDRLPDSRAISSAAPLGIHPGSRDALPSSPAPSAAIAHRPTPPLSYDELERIQLWIAAGARRRVRRLQMPAVAGRSRVSPATRLRPPCLASYRCSSARLV